MAGSLSIEVQSTIKRLRRQGHSQFAVWANWEDAQGEFVGDSFFHRFDIDTLPAGTTEQMVVDAMQERPDGAHHLHVYLQSETVESALCSDTSHDTTIATIGGED